MSEWQTMVFEALDCRVRPGNDEERGEKLVFEAQALECVAGCDGSPLARG